MSRLSKETLKEIFTGSGHGKLKHLLPDTAMAIVLLRRDLSMRRDASVTDAKPEPQLLCLLPINSTS
jgi:hypothetical protein